MYLPQRLFAETGPVELVLYTEKEVLEALEEISDHPVYSQILHLYFKEVITDQQRQAQLGEDNLHDRDNEVMLEFEADEVPGCQQVIDKASHITEDIIGKKPKSYTNLAKYSTRESAILGLLNQEQAVRLKEYVLKNGIYDLKAVNDTGSCMFAAIRRGINVPAEYTNAHFRRQLVMFMLRYKKYFYYLLKQSIMGIYGHERFTEEQLETLEKENLITEEEKKDQKMAGPHSFYSYLSDLLKPNTWGDEIILTVISMMWQTRITVLRGETLKQEKIRHTRNIEDCDILKVLARNSHYTGAGK